MPTPGQAMVGKRKFFYFLNDSYLARFPNPSAGMFFGGIWSAEFSDSDDATGLVDREKVQIQ